MLKRNTVTRKKTKVNSTLTGISFSFLLASFAIITIFFSEVPEIKTEICNNAVDDDKDGTVDESTCMCPKNERPFFFQQHWENVPVAQESRFVKQPQHVLGQLNSNFALFEDDSAYLTLRLKNRIPKNQTYVIYWSALGPKEGRMHVSISEDGDHFLPISTFSTYDTTLSELILTAPLEIRYLTFTVKDSELNYMPNSPSQDEINYSFRLYGVSHSLSDDKMYCDLDWDQDGISDGQDLDDDNDGIPDDIEFTGLDISRCDLPNFTFDHYSVESGKLNNEGCIYRFSNVHQNIDALIEVKTLNGVILEDIDLDSTQLTAALEPSLRKTANSDTAFAEFLISFVKANTASPVKMDHVGGIVTDIDGGKGNIQEAIGFRDMDILGTDKYSRLTKTIHHGITEFKGPSRPFHGRSRNIPEISVLFHDSHVSNILLRTSLYHGGSRLPATTRAFSIYFDPCISNYQKDFEIPLEYAVDTDKDGIPDFRDLDSDNDGLFDAEENGSKAISSQGIIKGNVNELGIPIQVEGSKDTDINFMLADIDKDGTLDYKSNQIKSKYEEQTVKLDTNLLKEHLPSNRSIISVSNSSVDGVKIIKAIKMKPLKELDTITSSVNLVNRINHQLTTKLIY